MSKKVTAVPGIEVYDYFRRPEWPPEDPIKEGHLPSPTEQSHKDSCDINHIVKRFRESGQIQLNASPGQFMDVTSVMSFQEAQQALIDGRDAFMSLNADTRKFFDNDPARFLDFMSDAKNVDKAVELGLVSRRKQEPREDLELLREIRENTKPRKKAQGPDDT